MFKDSKEREDKRREQGFSSKFKLNYVGEKLKGVYIRLAGASYYYL